MTPEERGRAFRAAVRRQLRARSLAIDEGLLSLLGTLAELQARIRGELEAQPSDFQLRHLPGMMDEVDLHIARWTDTARGVFNLLAGEAWDRGGDLVTVPLGAAEVRVGGLFLPASLVHEVKDYAADRISNIGKLARARIERHVRLAALGGQSMHDAMRGIGEQVSGPGPFRMVSFRAETIFRTELGRLHSAAADRRLQEAAAIVPGLKKKWLWSGKSRALHRAISGQVREPGEPFDLPDGVRMMYPRAGGAPVEHVANCGCESIPHKDAWS